MKKVLAWILCISASVLLLWEQSFAETFSFTSKDGRIFCEANKYDGSYRECTQEQISKKDFAFLERWLLSWKHRSKKSSENLSPNSSTRSSTNWFPDRSTQFCYKGFWYIFCNSTTNSIHKCRSIILYHLHFLIDSSRKYLFCTLSIDWSIIFLDESRNW